MIKFRRAKEKDIQRILQIHKLCFYNDLIKYGKCPAYNETFEGLSDYICNQIVYVILSNEKIIGDIIINSDSEICYDLEVIAIDPDFHNQGIGQKAMNFIEIDNPAINEWVLHTPHLEIRNHYFYEKLGYKKTSETVMSPKLTMFEYRKNN